MRSSKNISIIIWKKIDKYEYLTGKEILPSKKRQIIEQAKFAYSPFGKACEKQTKTIAEQGKKERKTIEEQGKKQVEALEVLKPEKDKEEIK